MSVLNKISTRKNFLILYGSIFLFFAVPYGIHLVKLGIAKANIVTRENRELENFNKQIDLVRNQFNKEYPKHQYYFNEVLSASVGKKYRDTIVSYFIYSNSLRINTYDLRYTTCLFDRAAERASKSIADEKFEKGIRKLEIEHGALAQEWANKIGQDKFLKIDILDDCAPYYKEARRYALNEKAISDFDEFLKEYNRQQNSTKFESERTKAQYRNEIDRLKANLNPKEKSLLEQQLENNTALKMGNNRFTFSGDELGSFDYTIPRWAIDEKILNDAMDIVYTEQYKTNSLKNGAMPYGYCYGYGNTGPSTITVNTGNSDVLVMLKNSNDLVVRHFYVQANNHHSVKINNGYYNVYFYYGEGWNPKKQMKDAVCGPLVGGFIYYEQLSKDPSQLSLHNDGIEYTLTKVVNGNLQTVPSSINEAL
tara:strand:+ start:12239 stop:13507 length:1269 start_codon:yes stop_codon:yes gene_type:complete